MPAWRAQPRAGSGCKFSQTVLGRRKEGRVAAEKKLALKAFLLDLSFARSGDA